VVFLLLLEGAWLEFKAFSAGENLAGERALGVSLAQPKTAFLLDKFHVAFGSAPGRGGTRSIFIFLVNLLLANAKDLVKLGFLSWRNVNLVTTIRLHLLINARLVFKIVSKLFCLLELFLLAKGFLRQLLLDKADSLTLIGLLLKIIDEACLNVLSVRELSVDVITDFLNRLLAVPSLFTALVGGIGSVEAVLGHVAIDGRELAYRCTAW